MVDPDLRSRPNLEQYRKQAKELLKRWEGVGSRETTRKLADAHRMIARDHGFDSGRPSLTR